MIPNFSRDHVNFPGIITLVLFCMEGQPWASLSEDTVGRRMEVTQTPNMSDPRTVLHACSKNLK